MAVSQERTAKLALLSEQVDKAVLSRTVVAAIDFTADLLGNFSELRKAVG